MIILLYVMNSNIYYSTLIIIYMTCMYLVKFNCLKIKKLLFLIETSYLKINYYTFDHLFSYSF